MKKDRLMLYAIVLLVCIVLTTFMFMQINTVNKTDITGIETAQEIELRSMLSSWKTKYEEAETKLKENENLIVEYKEKETSGEESMAVLQKDLQNADMLVGKTDIKGEGVIITLKNDNNKRIESDDLLTLVNELKLAGAEAISINGKRIVNMSEIVNVGGVILVNSERVASPYIVKAIGDQKNLSSSLLLKGSGFIDTYTNLGKNISLDTPEVVEIAKYRGPDNLMNFDYAREVKDEE